MNATEKRLTKKEQLIALMQDGRWYHMRQLNRICFRFGARFHEMRAEGYVVDKRSCGTDEWEYRLIRPVLRDRDAKQPALL